MHVGLRNKKWDAVAICLQVTYLPVHHVKRDYKCAAIILIYGRKLVVLSHRIR